MVEACDSVFFPFMIINKLPDASDPCASHDGSKFSVRDKPNSVEFSKREYPCHMCKEYKNLSDANQQCQKCWLQGRGMNKIAAKCGSGVTLRGKNINDVLTKDVNCTDRRLVLKDVVFYSPNGDISIRYDPVSGGLLAEDGGVYAPELFLECDPLFFYKRGVNYPVVDVDTLDRYIVEYGGKPVSEPGSAACQNVASFLNTEAVPKETIDYSNMAVVTGSYNTNTNKTIVIVAAIAVIMLLIGTLFLVV